MSSAGKRGHGWRRTWNGGMVDVIQEALRRLREFLDWAPNDVVGAIILILAAAIALLLYGAFARLARRLIRQRNPYLAGVLTGTKRLAQAGMVTIALLVALPAAPFERELANGLSTVLLIVAIVLIGWTTITASHIVADLYLLRFRLDVTDNLLARKHVTQVRVLCRVVD